MKELLLLLCRYPFNEANRERLSGLLREVQDWNKMINLINEHGIIALAAYNIKEAGLEKNIPKNAMVILENGYRLSMVRNSWLTERWKEVNEILCKAGIKHILLKGMALEYTLYEGKGLRQMNDNDIYIDPEESLKAWKLLQQNGFTLEPLKSPLLKKIMFEFGEHLPALYKNGYTIEIHNKLFDTGIHVGSEHNNLIEAAVEIPIGDQKALILPEDIHLKYLIKHFEKHALAGDCQLRLYADIKLLDPNINLEIPDRFISNPKQGNRLEFRKASYKDTLKSIPPGHRMCFIIGDLFPSITWMKDRYKCSGYKALLYYPQRCGKLFWLL